MIPYFKQQKLWTCGPASLRMVLAACSREKSEEELAVALGTKAWRGTRNADFTNVAIQEKYKFITQENSSIQDMQKAMKHGYFLVVAYIYEKDGYGHYGVIAKITADTIYIHDPWDGPDQEYTHERFLRLWHNHPMLEKAERWYFGVKP